MVMTAVDRVEKYFGGKFRGANNGRLEISDSEMVLYQSVVLMSG
jgi:hypothetical protein